MGMIRALAGLHSENMAVEVVGVVFACLGSLMQATQVDFVLRVQPPWA